MSCIGQLRWRPRQQAGCRLRREARRFALEASTDLRDEARAPERVATRLASVRKPLVTVRLGTIKRCAENSQGVAAKRFVRVGQRADL